MSKPIYSLSISARALINMHSLNNEGGEGNTIQTRMVDVVYYDEDGSPNHANVNAISGDMFKHILVEHFQRAAQEKGLDLCPACQVLDANRMNAVPAFRDWLKGKPKPTMAQVVDRLVGECALDDIGGNLVTEGGFSTPRKSVAEFGWILGVPEAVHTDEYFHVKYVPDRREKPEDKDGREGNLGQNIFHRPASSGVYALVSNYEIARIGYNDLTQQYIEGVDRAARLAALLESILHTFVEMNGAMRNTQLPHLLDLHGVVAVSRGVAPAPTVSPLNPDFVREIEQTQAALNRVHGADVIELFPFAGVGEFADVIANLAQDAIPFTMKTAQVA